MTLTLSPTLSPTPLELIHADIELRVTTIRRDHPDWLCGKGCAGCCQHLAEEPRLTTAEWRLLQTGLAQLTPQQLAGIRQRLQHMPQPGRAQPAQPVVCPLLEAESGTCPVYAQRPVACRTYGFYVQRDRGLRGLYCPEIEARVAAGALDTVVWGSHDAIDHQLAQAAPYGETRSLSAWFADSAELAQTPTQVGV